MREVFEEGAQRLRLASVCNFFPCRSEQDLGLTDDQVTKLKVLALNQDRARILAHADVQVAERELRALVADEKTELSVSRLRPKCANRSKAS